MHDKLGYRTSQQSASTARVIRAENVEKWTNTLLPKNTLLLLSLSFEGWQGQSLHSPLMAAAGEPLTEPHGAAHTHSLSLPRNRTDKGSQPPPGRQDGARGVGLAAHDA